MPAGTPVQVRLADEELDALDQYRREKMNPPTRGRALRELAREALCGHAHLLATTIQPTSPSGKKHVPDVP
jgi:hypothetical protein